MMSMTRILSAAALAFAIPLVAAAQTAPQYSSQEILKHFTGGPAGGADCPEGECLGKEGQRSVCLGTASDCAAQEVTARNAEGFDLLVTFEIGSDALSPQARANLEEFAQMNPLPTERETVSKFLPGEGDVAGQVASCGLQGEFLDPKLALIRLH